MSEHMIEFFKKLRLLLDEYNASIESESSFDSIVVVRFNAGTGLSEAVDLYPILDEVNKENNDV